MSEKIDQAYMITGLDCPACAERVVHRMEKEAWVEECNIDYGAGKIYLTAEKRPLEEIDKIVSSVEDAFHVAPIPEKPTRRVAWDRSMWIKLARVIFAFVVSAATTFAMMGLGIGHQYLWSVLFPVNLVAWLVAGYDVAWRFIKNVIHLRNIFDEAFLMTIASLGAFLLPLLSHDEMSFFDAVMVVSLYQLGELFDIVASRKSHNAIVDAVNLKSETATRIGANGLETVKPEDLAVGDLVMVKVGESFPSDGVIVAGEGNVDVSSLTGEFVPVYRRKGDEVLSGTTLKSGNLTVQITKPYSSSTLARIMTLVENSGRGKSKAEKFISVFSKYYTPFVVVLAAIVTLIPPLFLGVGNPDNWMTWVRVGLSFLVIACPCAIVLSVPLAYFAGIGLASKNGLIVKGTPYFDKLLGIRTVVSDKTGTLTYGDFQVTTWHLKNMDKCEFMHYLKCAESRSAHPIAKAIVGDAHDALELAAEQEDYEEIAGHGIKTRYKGDEILAGNAKLMNQFGIVPDEVKEEGTVVHLAVNGTYEGYVILNDVIRKESKKMVDGLHELGIKVKLFTGDQKKNAETVAGELGLDEVHAGLLPEEKSDLLKAEIAKRPGSVAFIGDGVNDAPSIALSDVGVAMGGIGSDSSISSADLVIMNDDPSKLVTAIKISKKARFRAISIIVLGLLIKASIMLISALLKESFPMWVAVLADTGLTVLMVLYAYSLLYEKVR